MAFFPKAQPWLDNKLKNYSSLLFFFFPLKILYQTPLFFCFLFTNFIYLFLAALGVCCCVLAFFSCGEGATH